MCKAYLFLIGFYFISAAKRFETEKENKAKDIVHTLVSNLYYHNFKETAQRQLNYFTTHITYETLNSRTQSANHL